MKLYSVNGTSMEPVLHNGQACMITDGCSKINLGEVLCISRFGQKVVHRLIVKQEFGEYRFCIEKGDNYPVACVICENDIVGKAIGISVDESRCIYSRCRLVITFRLYYLLEKMAKKLEKKNKDLGDKLQFCSVFVVPTICLHTATYKTMIRELKVMYSVYKKNQRMMQLYSYYKKS